MLTSLLVCTGLLAPLEPQSGTGSMYIFTQLGTPPTEICQVARTTELSLEDMLAGGLDHEICIDGGTDAQSRIEGRIDVYDGGMKVDVNGWGEAVGSDIHDAFSRHDADFSMIISVTEPVRMRVDWYHHAVGLGGAWLRVQRLYDPDGTWNPGPDVIDRSVSSYIDAVLEDGVDVLYFQPGGWSFRAVTTHQAMWPGKVGFQHSFARTNHTCTIVPLGDVDGDTIVDVTDLLTLLEAWGTCTSPCLADLNDDGVVDVEDALQVLADWG